MKLLLPAYSHTFRAFAAKQAQALGPALAAILNPNSGPGELENHEAELCLDLYNAIRYTGGETWVYSDLITGPQYSPHLTPTGELKTPTKPRLKTAKELRFELTQYHLQGFTAATGIFCDDATTKAHRALIAEAFPGLATMPNPGNWKDAQKFRPIPPGFGLVIHETTFWTKPEDCPQLEKGRTLEPGAAILALRCPAREWKRQLATAKDLGASYFYATDQPAPWHRPATYAAALAKEIAKL